MHKVQKGFLTLLILWLAGTVPTLLAWLFSERARYGLGSFWTVFAVGAGISATGLVIGVVALAWERVKRTPPRPTQTFSAMGLLHWFWDAPLRVGFVLTVAMVMAPPWRASVSTSDLRLTRSIGYSPLWHEPSGRLPAAGFRPELASVSIDWARLALQRRLFAKRLYLTTGGQCVLRGARGGGSCEVAKLSPESTPIAASGDRAEGAFVEGRGRSRWLAGYRNAVEVLPAGPRFGC